jgi:adenosine kinase
MRIAVTGSIATDHLLSFDGRFSDSVLPEQLGHLSVSFLASDLQVRRGGTGANIAFGMASLGASPLLVGGIGTDGADYLGLLERRGVDVTGVTTSATLATARFTCTTDLDHNQIATFYPGAMSEAAQIDLATLGTTDLVVIAPDDPDAMARHTTSCRDRGVPFAADPSQQLAFLQGPAIRHLVDGASWLFTNEYEAGLVREKTGWDDDEVLERVGVRVVTLGVKGVRISRKGEPTVEVGIVPAREVAEPTGVGDAFRAGFLCAVGWGLGLERAAQVGALLATYVVETVGTQEYAFTADEFAGRLSEAYGDEAGAEVRPHLAG